MSQSITGFLADFKQAIEANDYQTADEMFNNLTAHYDDREADEEAGLARAFGAHDITDAEAQAIQTYTGRAAAVTLGRMSFLMQVVAYLSDPEAADKAQVLDATQELREQETSLGDAEDAVADTLETVTVPAMVQLLTAGLPEGPYLKGKSDTLTIVVANVGDSSTEGSVTVTQPSGLGVSPTSTDLDLAAGERATVEVAVSYDTDGEYKLEVELDAGDAGVDVSMVRIDVDTKLDLINAALAGIDTLQERIEEAESLGTVQRTALDAELLLVEEQVELAQGLAEGGSTLLANTTLETAIIKMGAYLNELNLLLLEPDIHRALEQAGEQLIDQLVAAKHAEL